MSFLDDIKNQFVKSINDIPVIGQVAPILENPSVQKTITGNLAQSPDFNYSANLLPWNFHPQQAADQYVTGMKQTLHAIQTDPTWIPRHVSFGGDMAVEGPVSAFNDIPGGTVAERRANAGQFAAARQAEGPPVISGGDFNAGNPNNPKALSPDMQNTASVPNNYDWLHNTPPSLTQGGTPPAPDATGAKFQLFPDQVSASDAVPAQRNGFKIPGSFDPIDQIAASDAAKNSRAYAVTTPQIQDAYRRNGITDPAQVNQVKNNLFTQKINPVLQNDPTRIPLGTMSGTQDGIVPQIIAEMQQLQPALDNDAAGKAASGIITKLNKVAGLETDTPGATDLSLKGILNAKTDLNQSAIVKSGQMPVEDRDIATVASRNVLQKTLQTYAPAGITQAVTDYGLLEEGFPSYLKAVENPPAGRLSQLAKNPWIRATALGLGLADYAHGGNPIEGLGQLAGTGLGLAGNAIHNVAEKIAQNTQNNNHGQYPQGRQQQTTGGDGQLQNHNTHNTIIPSSYSTISADGHGHYAAAQTPTADTNTRHYMNESDYQNQLYAIAQRATPGTPQYQVATKALDQQYADEKQQASQALQVQNGDILGYMNQSPQYIDDGNQLIDNLHGAPTGFWNGLGKTKGIKSYTDPIYSEQLRQIANFNAEYAGAYKQATGKDPLPDQLLATENSPSQVGNKIKAMMQFLVGTHDKYLDPYLALTSATGSQTSYGTPQTATSGPAAGLPPAANAMPADTGGPALSHITPFIPQGQSFEGGAP